MSDTPVNSLPSISDLLSESFETCKKNLYDFFILSVIASSVYAVIGIIAVGVVFATGIGGAIMTSGIQSVIKVPGVISILGWLLLVVVVFAIVFGFSLQTAYILVAAGEKKGTYIDLLKKGLFLIPSFLWVSLLSLFLIWGSIFVFILPVILIGFLLTFTVYEVVLSGNRGIYAIQRSSYIVSQNFFPIVGRILFLMIAGFFISIPASAIQEFVADNSILVLIVVIISIVVNVLWSWFSIVYSVTLYRQAKAVVDPHKTSGLLWMWIVAGIGWVIGVVLLSTIGLSGYQMMTGGGAQGLLERAKEVEKKQQNLQDQKEKMSPAAELIKSGQLKLGTANQLAQKVSLTEDDKAQIRGLINGALDDFNSATEKNPTNYQAWYYRGEAYRNLIGLAKNADSFAIASYKKALEFNSSDYSVYLALGGVYYQMKDYDNAITNFQQVVRLQPTYANGYFNLGVAYKKVGAKTEAKKALQKASDLLPANDPTRYKVDAELQGL